MWIAILTFPSGSIEIVDGFSGEYDLGIWVQDFRKRHPDIKVTEALSRSRLIWDERHYQDDTEL
jgi:hypothetical protein